MPRRHGAKIDRHQRTRRAPYRADEERKKRTVTTPPPSAAIDHLFGVLGPTRKEEP
jgi:hypothetical protein